MTAAERAALAQHLKTYADLGVNGVSKDPKWRERQGDVGRFGLQIADEAVGRFGVQTAEADGVSQPETPYVPLFTSLEQVRAHIGDCTRCKLHKQGRKQVVFGVGNPNARLMFVGEAPGADEDQQGEPFVGKAGQLLTKIIEGGLNMTRADVYIANVIKCRPPGNRNPEPDEVATCEPFLFHQIDLIKPRVIVALGTHAAHALLKTDAPISRIRGKLFDYRGGSTLIPTFHPAFLLRSPERKRDVWEDIKKVRALLADAD